jgi:hypothetical protein
VADGVRLSGAKQAKSKADRKQQERDQISERIDPRAFLRIQVLRPRDFAIAAVENAVQVKEPCADNKSSVRTADQEQKTDQRKSRDHDRPEVWRNRRLEKESADRARNRAIQITRNKTVSRFAAATKKPTLRAGAVAFVANVSPTLTFPGTCIDTRGLKTLPEFLPNGGFVANGCIAFQRNGIVDELLEAVPLYQQAGIEYSLTATNGKRIDECTSAQPRILRSPSL